MIKCHSKITLSAFNTETGFLIIGSLFICINAIAQSNNHVEIVVTTDKVDRTYQVSESLRYAREIKSEVNITLVKIYYELGPEKQIPIRNGEIRLHHNSAELNGIPVDVPGFISLRLSINIDRKIFKKTPNIAVSPEQIRPIIQLPDDFFTFWESLKAESDSVPLDAQIELWKDKLTGRLNVFLADFRNYQNHSCLNGVLSIPQKEGKYPLLLQLPGSGIHSFTNRYRSCYLS